MEKLLFNELFDNITELYKNADTVYKQEPSDNIYRNRQHSVSSLIEDLFAGAIYRYLKSQFPKISFCCMIDYRMDIDKQIMFPDIAIIVEETEPTLVSYIDLKTDLGYKRQYYQEFDSIKKKVEMLRSAGAKIKNVNKNGQHLKISESLIWRIAVVSQENLGRKNMIETQAKADELKDYISLHFLSSGRHPNFKNRNLIDFHDDFEVFFKAIKNDFGNYVATIKN